MSAKGLTKCEFYVAKRNKEGSYGYSFEKRAGYRKTYRNYGLEDINICFTKNSIGEFAAIEESTGKCVLTAGTLAECVQQVSDCRILDGIRRALKWYAGEGAIEKLKKFKEEAEKNGNS